MAREKKPKEKSFKLDIFETLNAIDKKRGAYYSNLDNDVRKGFAPRVVLRWTSAVAGNSKDNYLLKANEVNKYLDNLYNHPELQYKLLTTCGNGQSQSHKWIPIAKNKLGKSKIATFVAKFWPFANDMEMGILLDSFTKESFTEFVNGTGTTPEEAKELIKQFDTERKISL